MESTRMCTSIRSPTFSRSMGAVCRAKCCRHSSSMISNAFSAPRFWRMSASVPRESSPSSRMEICTSKIAASSGPTCCSALARRFRRRSRARANASRKRAISASMAPSSMSRCRTSGTSHRSKCTGPTTMPGDAGMPRSTDCISFLRTAPRRERPTRRARDRRRARRRAA